MSEQQHRPADLVWTESGRQSCESQMDTETAVNLRYYLAGDFTNAKSWDELIGRLQEKGLHLRFDENRLVLVNDQTSVHLCTCNYLGFGFAKLAGILGKPHVHADSKKLVSSDFNG